MRSRYIRACTSNKLTVVQTFDGGIADEPFHEAHAGYTFCSLGCAKFVNRLRTANGHDHDLSAPTDPALTLRWLAFRQTDLLDPDAEVNDYPASDGEEFSSKLDDEDSLQDSATQLHQSPDKTTLLAPFVLEPPEAGMNGRPNKTADTCYGWWVCGSFEMMEQPGMYCRTRLQRYLLASTQHAALGGFGKFPGDLPDLYHSYLGLATLGLMGHGDVKNVDGTMCISKEASARLPALWDAWNEEK